MAEKNEEGLVAIVVATVMMIVLSLITLGFARLMQSEQRQALDRSLSTQAFYAAESAVNEVVSLVQSTDLTKQLKDDITSCNDPKANVLTKKVDASLSSSYTCVLVDQTPDTLEYTQGAIGITNSKVIPLNGDQPVKIGKVNIAWEQDSSAASSTAPTFPTSCAALPTFTGWTQQTGMLRIDVIPADVLDRDTLINGTISMYLYPCSGASSTSSILYSDHVGDANKGKIVPVSCNTSNDPRDCSLDIEMPIATANKTYYLRVRSVYKASDMTIRVYDVAGKQMPIRGAQVQIDATGKVNDVLRRIQVRVPGRTYPVPEYVLETTDSICKQIQVAPPSTVLGVGAGQTCPY